MTKNKVMQANNLYSCREFPEFRHGMVAFIKEVGAEYTMHDDLKFYLQKNKAQFGLFQLFDGVVIHRADNKDFFEWSEQRNGMMMPNPILVK